MKQKKFLTAAWKKLLMVNYEVEKEILLPFLPSKTELDSWNNKTYISLVGFSFRELKVKGLPVPFHRNFPEINLRFYVRHKAGNEWQRGVVFIKEFVPVPLVSFSANLFFHEHYSTLPMKYKCQDEKEKLMISYQWKKNSQWYKMEGEAENLPYSIQPGSKEEFISLKHWGYIDAGPGKTSQYFVEHPSWALYRVSEFNIVCDFEANYGKHFGFLNSSQPDSVFMAEGSPITIFNRRVL